MYQLFADFLAHQDQAHYNHMKQGFVDFYHDNLPIKKEYEPKRIFSKVINPLAFHYRKKGTYRGGISPTFITKADMMYNRDNFRDIYQDKPKDVTRKEWLEQHPVDTRPGYYEQQLSHARKALKANIQNYRNNRSELTMFRYDQDDMADPTQIHHIFPRKEFPDIMGYAENLIALTPNQHYGYAHPRNHTQEIDYTAQQVLLIAKTGSIRHNLESGTEEPIYEFENLLTVLATGWDDESVMDIAVGDYEGVMQAINSHY